MYFSGGCCRLQDFSFSFLLTHHSHSASKRINLVKHPICCATSEKSDSRFDPNPTQDPTKAQNSKASEHVNKNPGMILPEVLPKKRRRGRRSEAAAVEDFVRDSLKKTFASIRQQNSEILNDKKSIFKDQAGGEVDSDDRSDNDNESAGDMKGKNMVLEEEDPNWPLDADVGWGIRASEYFEKHPIKNVLGEDGVVIDWEGETDNYLIKEINCLEWESFAFHPSPLIVIVFERYKRAADNWKVLKELEKAAKVYWSAKDRLPPRTVKIDINIERDLAYALKVRECPQLLFLRGHMILHREKEIRTADELVQMIAHFYYNAKKPSWIS